MAPPKFRVLVIGGGIAGLSLGVMLERAGIDYIILESGNEIRPLGAVMNLGPSLMMAMEQLGIIDDISRNSLPMHGVTLMDEHLHRICRIDVQFTKERYGYYPLNILRPALYEILMSKIPAYKLIFGKKVIHVAQNDEGVLIRCLDGSTFSGDIVVGADGGESIVRELMYAELRSQNKLPLQDQSPVKLEQRCLVGISNPLDPDRYPVLKSDKCELHMVMPRHERSMIWFVPMPGHRFGWGITTALHAPNRKKGAIGGGGAQGGGNIGKSSGGKTLNTRSSIESIQSVSSPLSPVASSASKKTPTIPSSAMTSEYAPSAGGAMAAAALSSYTSSSTKQNRMWHQLGEFEDMHDAELRDQASPFGGTLGDIIDKSPRGMISQVITEEKVFSTWYNGRTVLVGDSCHRMIVSSGYGTTMAILDAITLVSLLTELPTNEQRDIETLFQIYYERRSPNVRAAIIANKRQEAMLFHRGLTGKVARKLVSNFVSEWLMSRMGDVIYGERPLLTFLKPLSDPGHKKNKAHKTQTPLLEDRRFDSEGASGIGINGAHMMSSFSGSQSAGSSTESLRSSESWGSSGGVRQRGREVAMGIIYRIIGHHSVPSSTSSPPSSQVNVQLEQERTRGNEPILEAISTYGSYYGVDHERQSSPPSTPASPPPPPKPSYLHKQQPQKQHTQHKLQRRLSSPPPSSLSSYKASRIDQESSNNTDPIDDHQHQHARYGRASSLGRATSRCHKTFSKPVSDHPKTSSYASPSSSASFGAGHRAVTSNNIHRETVLEGEEFEELKDDWSATRHPHHLPSHVDDPLYGHHRHRSRPPPPRRHLGEEDHNDGHNSYQNGPVPIDEERLFYTSWSSSTLPAIPASGPRSTGVLEESAKKPSSFSMQYDNKPSPVPSMKIHEGGHSMNSRGAHQQDHHDDDNESTSNASHSDYISPGARASMLLRPFLSSLPTRRGANSGNSVSNSSSSLSHGHHHLHHPTTVSSSSIGGSSTHSGSHIGTHSHRPSSSSASATTVTVASSIPAVAACTPSLPAPPLFDYFLPKEPHHSSSSNAKQPPPAPLLRSQSN